MRTSAQFSLAIHVLMMMACFPEDRVTSEPVGSSLGCNPVVVRRTFLKLRDAGLLRTQVGQGRNSLARRPERISLWDVFRATETARPGEVFRQYTPTGRFPLGQRLSPLLDRHFDAALAAMGRELDGVSLADLMEKLRQGEDPPRPERETRRPVRPSLPSPVRVPGGG